MPYTDGTVTFIAQEALATRRRVKFFSGSVTDPVQVHYADAGEQHIGITEAAAEAGDVVTVRLRNHTGTHEAVAAGAFARGATLFGAADGKVDDAASGTTIGIALSEGVADGDHVVIYSNVNG